MRGRLAGFQSRPNKHFMVEDISPNTPKKLRIILLEDEPLLAKLFEFCFQEWFHELELLKFNNGDEVWQELSGTKPDLLIMDWSHPGLEGKIIMDRLAELKAGFPILLTSDFFEEHVQGYVGHGLKVVFLPKPFGLKKFWKALNQLVGPGDFPERAALLDE